MRRAAGGHEPGHAALALGHAGARRRAAWRVAAPRAPGAARAAPSLLRRLLLLVLDAAAPVRHRASAAAGAACTGSQLLLQRLQLLAAFLRGTRSRGVAAAGRRRGPPRQVARGRRSTPSSSARSQSSGQWSWTVACASRFMDSVLRFSGRGRCRGGLALSRYVVSGGIARVVAVGQRAQERHDVIDLRRQSASVPARRRTWAAYTAPRRR